MQRSSNIKHATQSQEIGRTSSKFMNLNLGHQMRTEAMGMELGKVEAVGGDGDGDGDGDGEWRPQIVFYLEKSFSKKYYF